MKSVENQEATKCMICGHQELKADNCSFRSELGIISTLDYLPYLDYLRTPFIPFYPCIANFSFLFYPRINSCAMASRLGGQVLETKYKMRICQTSDNDKNKTSGVSSALIAQISYQISIYR